MINNGIEKINFSVKQLAFLKCNCKREFLEGTTFAGKTMIASIKFILKVSISKKTQHFISGKDLGTLVKNIVSNDNGILKIFGSVIENKSAGSSAEPLPHLILHSINGNKIIYLMGYDTIDRWEKALGGQYGCGLVDEINIANINYIREISMRCDYLCATLNPDDPELDIYREMINHSRPLKEFEKDYPEELINQLLSQEAFDNWVHWYLTFNDNPIVTEIKINDLKQSVPFGTKQYKSKILGLRGKSEGLVYLAFDRNTHCINQLSEDEKIFDIILGIDEGTHDPTSIIPFAITTAGKIFTPEIFYYDPSEKGHRELSHGEIVVLMVEYLIMLCNKYNYFNSNGSYGAIVGWCDSSEAGQQLIMAFNQLTYSADIPFSFCSVGQKDRLADKNRLISLISLPNYYKIELSEYYSPLNKNKLGIISPYIRQLETLTYNPKTNMPNDGNDHAIDGAKYGTYGLRVKGYL